ncbi:MAG: PilW family protein [Methylotenera sp.]
MNKKAVSQAGFSLVELMVGLVIGLLATLAIMQVFGAFEEQKRSTSGTADAQTNGSVALYNLQRDVRLAGFGLPLFDKNNLSLKCAVIPTINHDVAAPAPNVSAATPNISLAAIDIIDGGTAAGASDTVIVRYGNSPSGGIVMPVVSVVGADVGVLNSMGCAVNDIAISIKDNACVAANVETVTDATDVMTLKSPFPAVNINDSFACLGRWNEYRYAVLGNQLTRFDTYNNTAPAPMVAGIVNIQAQYGISDKPDSNQITQWVNATGAWETQIHPATGAYLKTPGNVSLTCNALNANRNCIKAVRVAIVARNDLLEKTVVTSAAVSSWGATSASPTVASPAPIIDLSNIPNWNQYRYKVYESIIPLRNIIWTRERLEDV